LEQFNNKLQIVVGSLFLSLSRSYHYANYTLLVFAIL